MTEKRIKEAVTAWQKISDACAASCNNKTLPEAVEFIGDAICSHFAKYGLNVEFVNA